MVRPKIKDSEKKVRVNISISKSVYENSKREGLCLSRFLDVNLRNYFAQGACLVNRRSRVQFPPEAYQLIFPNFYEGIKCNNYNWVPVKVK